VNNTLAPEDDTVTSWSTSGITQDGFTKPELVAPGRHVVSVFPSGTSLAAIAPLENIVSPGYARMNGTSFSAPQVAGAAAILLQAHPEWTPDQIKWVLMKTARSTAGGTAAGLDLAAAIAFAGTPGSANQGIPYSTYALPGSKTSDFRALAAITRAELAKRNALAYERRASATWDAAVVAPKNKAAKAWQSAAKDGEKAALAWDRAAEHWDKALVPLEAADSAQRSALAWQKTAQAWDKAGEPKNAAEARENSATAWDKSVTWDRSVTWDKSVTWDFSVTWDRSVTWD